MSKVYRVDAALMTGDVVPLDAHRFVSVLRLGPGDVIVLCDAGGALHRATITELRPLAARIDGPYEAPRRDAPSPLEVWMPLLKGGKSDELVRQLTELGATRIVPFSSRFSVVRLDGARAAERRRRFEAIAREACNQSGRTALPEIAEPLDGLPSHGPGAFLWEGGGAPALSALVADPELGGRILSGPEGGLEAGEAERLISNNWKPLTLGARILRADTASIVLASLAQAVRGALE